MQLSTQTIDETGSITVTCRVTNSGDLTAKYSVLLFLSQIYRQVTPEYKLLKRFSKVELAPGESINLDWTLSAQKDLVYVGIDGR